MLMFFTDCFGCTENFASVFFVAWWTSEKISSPYLSQPRKADREACEKRKEVVATAAIVLDALIPMMKSFEPDPEFLAIRAPIRRKVRAGSYRDQDCNLSCENLVKKATLPCTRVDPFSNYCSSDRRLACWNEVACGGERR